MNKKGALASMTELMFATIFFVLVLVIFFIFSAIFGPMKVDATLTAENAAFTCANNLIILMGTASPHSDLTFSDILISSHAAGNYTEFEEKVTNYLEAVAVASKRTTYGWQMHILTSEREVHEFGKQVKGDSETCEYRVPLPCRAEQDCTLIAVMELEY